MPTSNSFAENQKAKTSPKRQLEITRSATDELTQQCLARSAIGTKRTCREASIVSANPPKADIAVALRS